MTGTITVLIVDDHRSFAELLAAALDNVEGLTCVGIATTASAGITMVAELAPSVVVMDIQMPDEDGLVTTKRIREVAPDAVVAVVTAHQAPHWVDRAAEAGASAFIPKNGSLAQMIDILQRVRPGRMIVGAAAVRSAPSTTRRLSGGPIPALTSREMDVLTCLGQGMPAPGIARTLGISLHTCRGYVKSLHNKLGVTTQLKAVIKAQQLGLFEQMG